MSDLKLFVPPGHFYSPIVDPREAKQAFSSTIATRDSLPGIELNLESMIEFWREIQPQMIEFGLKASQHGKRYSFENGFFDYGDALIYRSIISKLRPNRVVEIGSGYSSALLLDVLDEFHISCRVTLIEPYPAVLNSRINLTEEKYVELMQQKVQDVDLALFDELKSGDILFIDSSHVAKTGSDVIYELFQIVPRLQSGVFVHLHDIFDGFEYPESWVLGDNRSWNEAYLLRALLTGSSFLEVYFFNDYFRANASDLVEESLSLFKRNPGGSVWLKVRERLG